MKFDTKQKNELLTGVTLAVELDATLPELRKFLTVFGYNYDNDKEYIDLSKTIRNGIEESVYFELRCYEIPKEYYINKWDVGDDVLINDVKISDIRGLSLLEEKLKVFLNDFSILRPEWYYDNLL